MVYPVHSDYVYLVNGMNCSVFHGDRITYMDHPGLPLQMFFGIFPSDYLPASWEVLIQLKIPVFTGKPDR